VAAIPSITAAHSPVRRHAWTWLSLLLPAVVLLVFWSPARARAAGTPAEPAAVTACLTCHDKPGSTMQREGKAIPIHVDGQVYRDSAHGILACERCHTEAGPGHAANPEQPLGLPTGRALDALIAQRCEKCHAGHVTTSYNASFHGFAVGHGDLRAATCVDCHGVHNVFSISDARSTAAPANIAATCAAPGCHESASPGFAQGTEHFVREVRASSPIIYWIWKFFIALILFDVMKDGPIVMFELLRRVRGV